MSDQKKNGRRKKTLCAPEADHVVHAARLIKACGSVEEAERALRTAGLVASTLE